MPRKQVCHTYGRHRQRVVTVDVWSDTAADRPPRERGLFSSFSSSDSAQNDSGDVRSSAFTSVKNPPRKCKASLKENSFDESPSWIAEPKTRKRQTYKKNATKASSQEGHVLRDHNKPPVSEGTRTTRSTRKKKGLTEESTEKSKTRRKTAAKSGNTTRRKTNRKIINDSIENASTNSIETSRKDNTSRFNFSEFEKYSLLISGSPQPASDDDITTPDLGNSISSRTRSHKDALTSTPHIDKEQKNGECVYHRLPVVENSVTNLSNLSHIDDSPATSILPARVTRRRGGRKIITDPILEDSILECSEKLDEMHLSSVSSIASSPADSSRGSPRLSLTSAVQEQEFGQLNGSRNTSKVMSPLGKDHDSSVDDSSFQHSNISDRMENHQNLANITNRRPHRSYDSGSESSSSEASSYKSLLNCSQEEVQRRRLTGNLFVQKVYHSKSDVNLTSDCNRRVTRSQTEVIQQSNITRESTVSSHKYTSQYDASQSLFDHSHFSPNLNFHREEQQSFGHGPSPRVPPVLPTIISSGEESESESESNDSDYEVAEWEPSELSGISEEGEDQSSFENGEDHTGHRLESIHETVEVSHVESPNHHHKHSPEHKNNSEAAPKSLHTSNAVKTAASHSNDEAVSEIIERSPSYNKGPIELKTPCTGRIRDLIQQEIQNSRHSLRVMLTPIKVQTSGELVSPKEKLLGLCEQTDFISFQECIPPTMMRKCKKIGEGVYGEVFRSERSRQSVALKVIPIEGDFPVNDEQQKTFEEILPEIVISKELSALRDRSDFNTENFVQVRKVSVVKGCYPDTLLRQWDIFHKAKVSENDRPDMFDDDQLFIVFEFEDCGSDLEGVKLTGLHQAKSILHQVTCSLAIAEEGLQFEHRDLHWGNVLVKPTRDDALPYTLGNETFDVETQGIKVAVIDFTLSRLSKDGCNVFTDLSVDPTLFEGKGDYQFEVYRLMREENGNEWSTHHPYTNVLWIHYLTAKLLDGKTYPKSSSKEHQSLSRQFRSFLREATQYNSALHLLAECPFFKDCVIKES